MPLRTPRKRYVLFRWRQASSFRPNRLEIQDLLGIARSETNPTHGQSKTSLTVFDPEAGLGIIRTTNESVMQVKKRLMESVEGSHPLDFQVILVSGSIKKLKTKAALIKAVALSAQQIPGNAYYAQTRVSDGE